MPTSRPQHALLHLHPQAIALLIAVLVIALTMSPLASAAEPQPEALGVGDAQPNDVEIADDDDDDDDDEDDDDDDDSGGNGGSDSYSGANVPDHLLDRVISVRLAPGSKIKKVNKAHKTSKRHKMGSMGMYLLKIKPNANMSAMLAALNADSRVLWAEPVRDAVLAEAAPFDNYIWGISDPSELYPQAAFDQVELGFDAQEPHSIEAHELATGSGVTVAILDTGADLEHRLLDGGWHPGFSGMDYIDQDEDPEEESDGVDDDGDGDIDESYGHGTHVAGIVRLIAPDAMLLPMRVLDPEGYGLDYNAAAAIIEATDRGADVISLSLEMAEPSAVVADAVTYAHSQGALVVASAGNAGLEAQRYPAANGCALGVASVGETDLRSSFSNFGSWLDMAQPGEAIISAYPLTTPEEGDPFDFVAWSGTSAAAPFVSGHAALLYEILSDPDPGSVSRYIAGTAASVDPANPGEEGLLGHGLSQIVTSLELAQAGNPPATNPLQQCAGE